MTDPSPSEGTAYDKYVNMRLLLPGLAVFVALLLLPVPRSMLDVGVEYAVGRHHVYAYYAQELFGQPMDDVAQWQGATVRILEANLMQGVLDRETVVDRSLKSTRRLGVSVSEGHFEQARTFLRTIDEERFHGLMVEARATRFDNLRFADLDDKEQQKSREQARQIKICLAMVAFVVFCFVTEAIPLPAVAFCIGLILVFGGVVGREEVASLFWSDAVWFIMGSLMFAAAFVKTGVDKRICLLMFRYLARPSVRWITLMMILVIAPAAAFISDHALAAIFLPIGIILYRNSLDSKVPQDTELAKMLMICIAMACNIGGFGSPSGGARNVIMMTYLEDMFGITMGYGQWMVFAMPFVVVMIPILWVLLNWRFKPKIHDLGPALETLKQDIGRSGRWTRVQIVTVVVFAVMLFGWITEKNLIQSLIGVRLGIGVIAVAGAVAYLLLGVVNWRDYQEKVDWGVVWLYAGAIIFGHVLDTTGCAYWMARSIVEGMSQLGLESGYALLGLGGVVTAGLTNLMADGPAAAAVGPITLNMAAIANPGTVLVPFMALMTAASSSFAYLLIIGTPPNAIVYASGFLEPKDFLRVGIPCLVVAFVVLMLLSMLYWPMLGFPGMQPL